MSEFIFPRAVSHPATLRLRLAALAVVMGLVFLLGAGYLGLKYLGYAGNNVTVTVKVSTLGDSLGVGSSIKYRGLRVGRVVTVANTRSADGTYEVRAALDADEARNIPRSVLSRVLPGSIFGAEYIDLSAAQAPIAVGAVRDGMVIGADTSSDAIRVMDTLNSAQRVLAAIDPTTLNKALSQLADALDGKGATLHDFIVNASDLLKRSRTHEPSLYADLDLLADNLKTTADLEPILAQAVRASLPTAKLISEHAQQLQQTLKTGTTLTGNLAAFTQAHGQDLVDFFAAVQPTYETFVGGIDAFTAILQGAPAVLANGTTAVRNGAIQMMAYFKADIRNPYTAADCPRYGSLAGSNCK